MKDKIEIYICDDNQNFIEEISQRTQALVGKNRTLIMKTFNDGRELIAQWNEKFADVVFLDIDMPSITGFEVAEELQKSKRDAIIIFITSHEDKVYQSWDFQPFWFVRKSHLNDLDKVFPRLLLKIDSENEKEKHIFNLVAETKVVDLDINSVKYIQALKHYVLIKYINGEQIKVRCKISDAEQQLQQLYFIRIQTSALVNIRFIAKITSRDVILTDGESLHVNRERLESVRDEFQKFIRSR